MRQYSTASQNRSRSGALASAAVGDRRSLYGSSAAVPPFPDSKASLQQSLRCGKAKWSVGSTFFIVCTS